MIDSIFAFIDPVSAVYYGGSGWLRAYQSDYVIDDNVEPAVIDGYILLLWINIIALQNLHHIVCLQRLELFVAFLYSLSIYLFICSINPL